MGSLAVPFWACSLTLVKYGRYRRRLMYVEVHLGLRFRAYTGSIMKARNRTSCKLLKMNVMHAKLLVARQK